MAFKKGDKKPENSGRKKGTPHKKSLLVREILENHGINLFEQILVRLPKLEPRHQMQALTAMLPYVYPKLNSHELSTSDVQGFKIIVEDYAKTGK
jgi:hypothetical protein